MKIFNFGRKSHEPTRNQGGDLAAAVRAGSSMGPWTATLGQWQPRQHTPWLYEALREAVPVLDGGINRLVTLDGIVEVQGDNDKLVAEIQDWMDNVPVNDLEAGYQAFYAGIGGENYEQGVGVGEFVYDAKGRDVIGLRVADSKGIVFQRDNDRMRIYYQPPGNQPDRRTDGLGTVEQVLRGTVRGDVGTGLLGLGYTELDPLQLVIALQQPEADNPYGTSILRSVPFVAQILLRLQNATGRAWERFGDPPFHVSYATKNRKIDSVAALSRARQIVTDLGTAMAAKARGNSVDLATGAGADDEIKIEVIGAQGEALEIEMPGRHMIEQIVAAFGLPPWMLGITWSQAAGIGEQQSVVVLQESQTRFERRRPGLRRPIEAMLRARGRTWKAGDWELVQRLPNLMDEQKRAQAEFLRAQTALMLGERGQPSAPSLGTGIDNNLRSLRSGNSRKSSTVGRKASGTGEPFAEDDPALPKIETRTVTAMTALWQSFGLDVLVILGLTGALGDELFEFDPNRLADLLSAGEVSIQGMSERLLTGQTSAFSRGVANAGAQLSVDFRDPDVIAAIGRMEDRVREVFRTRGLTLVRDGFAREYREKIVGALASGRFDSQHPTEVARMLREQFDGGDYNWERLARSEVAAAQVVGKRDLMREQGVEQYDYVTAGDAKVSAICLAHEAGSPYSIGDASAPLPMIDSHPNCFPAGTLVRCPPLVGSTQRWYEGEFVQIVTALGNDLTVTPNHPILTPKGWVAAGLVSEGDHVVSYAGGDRLDGSVTPDDQNRPALIEDVAVSLGAAAAVAPVAVPSTTVDFHGDGMQPDIDVVEAFRLLDNHAIATAFDQERGEGTLGVAAVRSVSLPAQGALPEDAGGVNHPSPRGVRGADPAHSIFRGGSLSADKAGLALVAQGHTVALEHPSDGWPTDADFLREGLEAFASLVAPDEVVSVRKFDASQWVYNLETVVGWYCANGIVAHNCRCTVSPVA